MPTIVEKKPRGCKAQWWWCRQWHSLADQRISLSLHSFFCLFPMVYRLWQTKNPGASALACFILLVNLAVEFKWNTAAAWLSVCVPYLEFNLICRGQWTVEDRLVNGTQYHRLTHTHCPWLHQRTRGGRIHKHFIVAEKEEKGEAAAQTMRTMVLGKRTLPACWKNRASQSVFSLFQAVFESVCVL